MKHPVRNAFIGGAITLVLFAIVCHFLTFLYAPFIKGDPFIISYHIYTYVGITLLGAIIVFSTVLIIGKVEELEGKISPQAKNQDKNKDDDL